MFGYVRPAKPDLLIRDFEQYRAIYCGLCKRLGRQYTYLARMFLNYDLTAFALIRISLRSGCPAMLQKRCAAHFFTKRTCCVEDEDISYAADLLILFAFYKLKDDLTDTSFLKKLLKLALYPFLGLMHRKASKRLPDEARMFRVYRQAQQSLEAKPQVSPDEASLPTAELVSGLLPYRIDDPAQSRILRQLGFYLGKWIYLIDALDDLEDDRRSGNFNPFRNLPPDEKDLACILLTACVNEMIRCTDLLPFQRYEMLVKNIFFLGLPGIQEQIAGKKGYKHERSL